MRLLSNCFHIKIGNCGASTISTSTTSASTSSCSFGVSHCATGSSWRHCPGAWSWVWHAAEWENKIDFEVLSCFLVTISFFWEQQWRATASASAVLVWKRPRAKTTHGNSYLNYGTWHTNFAADYSQIVCTMAEVASGKGHAQTVLIYGRDSFHGWMWSLVHACVVAIVATLTDSRQSQTLFLFMAYVPWHNCPMMMKHSS